VKWDGSWNTGDEEYKACHKHRAKSPEEYVINEDKRISSFRLRIKGQAATIKALESKIQEQVSRLIVVFFVVKAIPLYGLYSWRKTRFKCGKLKPLILITKVQSQQLSNLSKVELEKIFTQISPSPDSLQLCWKRKIRNFKMR